MRRRERQTRGRLATTSATLATLAALVAFALAGCGATASGAASQGVVSVAYAGSLTNVMERSLGPGFERASGYSFQGKGAGSTALANQIAGRLIQPDVFISASAGAYKPLEGSTHGNLVRWYVSFAGTSMAVGYSAKSPFASQLASAARGSTPWYTVLQSPGLRLGRTDPALDPKGVNTLFTLQLAERYYQQPGLARAILGADDNPAQIFPEEELVARLTAGQLDAGFFYLNEVRDAGLPYIPLPAQINLGDPSQAAYYAQAHYPTKTGTVQTGAPVLYSVTIPATVRNQAGAVAFVRYLLSGGGKTILSADGISQIPLKVSGDASAVPDALKPVVTP